MPTVDGIYPILLSNCLFTRILSLTLSTFRTSIFSVPMPKTSFGEIPFRDKSPVTEMFVTIPVVPVVPIPVFNCKNDVLNPIWCLPSNLLRVSVERPEIVTISPTTKSWGWDESPVTCPFWLLYVNTKFSILTTVEAIETISFPSTFDISPEKPLPLSKLKTRRSSLTW